MCHQVAGLAAAEIEPRGIATTSITILPEITAKIGVPRALEVPWPLGYPLGLPGDADLQRRVIRAALALTDRVGVPLVEPFVDEPAAP
jgi:hypothetical protein